MCVTPTFTGSSLVHMFTRDTSLHLLHGYRNLYRFLYMFFRYTCHSLSEFAVSQVWDNALVVGPGDCDAVVACVSCWHVASSVGSVGPACADCHCSPVHGWWGEGERRQNPPPTSSRAAWLGGQRGGLSGPEFAYVHSHVSGFLEGFYNGWLYFCPAHLVVSGAAADSSEFVLGGFL